MSGSQERFRKADELARGLEEAVRSREADRDRERERLERMHAEESEEEGRLLAKVRTLRTVEQFYLARGPEQHLRLSWTLYRFIYLLVLLPVALGWIILDQVLVEYADAGGGQALMWGLLYALAALVLLLWHHHRSWARARPGRVLEACCWTVCLVPAAVAALSISTAAGPGGLEWLVYAAISAITGAGTARMSVFAGSMRRLSHQAMRERDQG